MGLIFKLSSKNSLRQSDNAMGYSSVRGVASGARSVRVKLRVFGVPSVRVKLSIAMLK